MNNSTYKPVKVSDFEASKLNFLGVGIKKTCTAGMVTNIDYKFLDDCLMTGGRILANNATYGDQIDLEIIDLDNILGAGAGFIANKFISGWYIQSGSSTFAVEIPYPAKVYAGLYVRVVYTSIGGSSADFAINYSLHKVLI